MGKVQRPKKLSDSNSKRALWLRFCDITGYSIPFSYFLSADCYGLHDKDGVSFVAGFVLKRGPLEDLRVWQEIPEGDEKERARQLLSRKVVADTTGYFVQNENGFMFTLYFAFTVLLYPASYFMYSYDRDNMRLKKYYGRGFPHLLYSGVPALISGYTERQPPVNVEILTKYGVLRIFAMRTKQLLMSILRGASVF